MKLEEFEFSPDQVILTPPKGWKTQRRWLDTCGCVFQEAWNPDALEIEEPIPYKIEKLCPAHMNLYNKPAKHHAIVVSENKLKNEAIKHALESIPDEYKVTKKDDDTGEEYTWFKEAPIWSFNEKRELNITIPGVTESVKKKIAASYKSKLPGKPINLK